MTYTAQYNRSARQWDVIDDAGEIVSMCGGGKRGQQTAERKARNLTGRPAWAVTERDELKAEIAGRKAAAAYMAGDSLG